jgi:integrase/recombinase XerD
VPRKGQRRARSFDRTDPEGLGAWLERYLEWLRIRGYSDRTVGNRRNTLEQLFEWLDARDVTRPQEVTRPVLERYQRHLFYLRKPDGKPLSFRAQHSRLVPVRAFFRWLARQGVTLANPAADLDLPRLERRLPKCVLTALETERVLEQPDVSDPLGLRDRAILEVLYSTGIRRSEVVRLGVYDLDAERGTLTVRQGKGKKDRVVPIGERAIYWVRRYLDQVREDLVMPPDENVLFLTRFGEGFRSEPMTHLVRGYIDAAELGKTGACHLLRHTCATLMHENGADIRYLQELLGHAELSTTQIYVQLGIRQLKVVHAATHPAAAMPRPLANTRPEPDDALDEDALDDAV